MIRLAVIGLGGRASSLVNFILEESKEVVLKGVADLNPEGSKKRMTDKKIDFSQARFYPDADALLADADQFDGVIVGTRCHLHTPMALKVAKTRLPLYLEKPVSITWQQANDLAAAFKGRENKVMVSFPLRLTPLVRVAREMIQSGRLGRISQIQAWNNVNYGGVYFGNWYRNYELMGGLWLQKATHDFDYVHHIMGIKPVMIAATSSRTSYGGNMQDDMTCDKCDRQETCPESWLNQSRRHSFGGMPEKAEEHHCPFGSEIKNQDSGTAFVQYEDGTHASYVQNFLSRRSAGSRGARIIGYRGTVEFDWYTNKVRFIDHMDERVDTIEFKDSFGGHGGGDGLLAKQFIEVMRGGTVESGNLMDGLLSAATCLAARDSAYKNTFEKIRIPGQAPLVIPDRQAMNIEPPRE